MFVGGLKDNTTEDMVMDVFSQYEEIREIELMIDRATGRSRGFALLHLEIVTRWTSVFVSTCDYLLLVCN
jgi:RNA recognition motif-containing protein